MTNEYQKAVAAKAAYKRGAITKSQAMEMMADYIAEFNAKSREVAKKYNQRPKLFRFEAFVR